MLFFLSKWPKFFGNFDVNAVNGFDITTKQTAIQNDIKKIEKQATNGGKKAKKKTVNTI